MDRFSDNRMDDTVEEEISQEDPGEEGLSEEEKLVYHQALQAAYRRWQEVKEDGAPPAPTRRKPFWKKFAKIVSSRKRPSASEVVAAVQRANLSATKNAAPENAAEWPAFHRPEIHASPLPDAANDASLGGKEKVI